MRVCIDPINREKSFKELKLSLLQRGYNEKAIDSSIEKARQVPRLKALKKVNKDNKSKGPVFAVLYDPRLPAIGSTVGKHWRSMTSRIKYLSQVFPRPPLIAFKRQKNLRQHIIRAKVQNQQREQRKIKGMQ